ncbi:TOMM precursor leader peptide-binding protein [Streptomyces sp. NPDC020379]|uniref:TOMM precursor leader peptide-binding protein n=1 Tax=Streptomyces sp. NPDC020379 TaxID=3365071 RepID=UPI0037ACFB44
MTKVHVLAVGDFGVAVAERLRREHDGVVVTTDRDGHLRYPAGWPRADVRVLVSWREVPHLADVLDARSADWRTPWFPIVAEHPRLRIGPLVVPGAGACYRCFGKRRKQHERDSAITSALHAHYDATPAAGPEGFLPQHVALAAGSARDLLHRLEDDGGQRDAGTVRHWHLLEQLITSARVVGVHGCDRCRTRAGAGPDGSSWQDLADDLAPWLPATKPSAPGTSTPVAAPSIPARQ